MARAQQGKLDPVIGATIRRVVQCFRAHQEQPVLISDRRREDGHRRRAGCRIVEGDVPESLKGKRVSLDLGALVAGTSTAAGSKSGSRPCCASADAQGRSCVHRRIAPWSARAKGRRRRRATLLKPAWRVAIAASIEAARSTNIRKYIEKDAALERRFQPVYIGEPSVEDTVSILRGLKTRYEAHHGVKIKDSALVAAAELSDRYIADRFLPDKAIDLVDEAASRVAMELQSVPAPDGAAARQPGQRGVARRRRRHRLRTSGRNRNRDGRAEAEGSQPARAVGKRKAGAGRRQDAARTAQPARLGISTRRDGH